MEKETPKAPEKKVQPVFLHPHVAPNGAVLQPMNPENMTKKDLKALKITGALNVALLAGVIAMAPYMKNDAEKVKEQPKAKQEQYAEPAAAKQDSVAAVDFTRAAVQLRNKTR